MQANERPALCVSIHDVAPATWAECLHLLHAIRAVADIPLSWLVVPCYHGSLRISRPYERSLERLLGQGHELVLHGYTHRDESPPAASLREWVLRTIYTEGEGEFAALSQEQARRRIELGLHWFGQRNWPVAGFVAPAWLISAPAERALRQFPFEYTSTYGRFHCLRAGRSLFAPSMVYAARNRWGRVLSPAAASVIAQLQGRAPLLRLALHPRDAHHPGLVRHAQGLIEHLLQGRQALTKGGFAGWMAAWATSTGPSSRPSGLVHKPPTSEDGHNVPPPPWR
ncbi:polysaccharide deacetylase family protein [Massilia sp. PAMC28688]|uniref:DUF2334 domain-containing protein n=1 Tax=Massilia sp. PAMC28688 TaxID=2861283 RepID=UPI001C62D410|nr:polysaccharide deacetylase family protein [Massilia sp. PAMC28688]QYF93872.1 polysaccharide deacetylase family protein [Massilia sp. PAMC28688]